MLGHIPSEGTSRQAAVPGAVIQDPAAACVGSFVLQCCSKPHVPPWLAVCSVLAPGPSATAARGAAVIQCVMHPTCSALELRNRETTAALSPGHSLLARLVLSTRTSAMWIMGEFPGAAPWGRGEFVSKIPLSFPCLVLFCLLT